MKILTAALAALLLAGPVRAEDKPAPTATDSVMTFFRHLKESLAQSAIQAHRKKNRVGSVAAVRGADQTSQMGDPNETSLKGDARSKKERAAMAEDAEFAKAVDLILAGKNDEGVKALEDFKAKHPKSHNLAKVDEAIAQAKTMGGAKVADSAPAPVPASSADAPKEGPKADAPAAEKK